MNEFNSRLELYWNDIPIGKENAIDYAELLKRWNKGEREVRRILHDLSIYDNGDNYILIRSGSGKGFFKTDDPEIIKAFKHECLNKGRSVFAPVKKINRVLNANADQFSIENNMRLVRESCLMRQSEVCKIMRKFDHAFDKSMLSKMENGICLPTPLQLSKLAEIYSCDPSELITADLFF